LLGREAWVRDLLGAIGAGTVERTDLDASRSERLVTHRNPEIRSRASELLAGGRNSTRDVVLADHASVLTMTGDRERGRVAFEKRCAACHKLDGLGRSLGADLAALKDRSSGAVLTAILDPNRAVEAKFLSYTVVLLSGRSIDGMLLSESGNSLVLIGGDGKEHVLQRSEIDELIASNRSLMPEGLEKDLSKQDLADVISFVQQSGVSARTVDGNKPQRVVPAGDGTLALAAVTAEIYGPTLTLESHFKNLGWWSSADDYAAWSVELARETTFEVEFDFACHRSAAGDQIDIRVGTASISGRVPSTDRWDRYGKWSAGKITLPAGVSRFVVSTPVKPKQALIDLRTIVLKPVD
jgi:putative heme-binding domain-containing protein